MTAKQPAGATGTRLANRTAVITGAGGPMGRAIARRFAEEGARLVLMEISARRLEETEAELRGAMPNSEMLAIRCSALVEDEVNAAIAQAVKAFGSLELLANVVGGIRCELAASILGMTEQRFDDTMALNLKTVFNLTRAVAPLMLKNGYGRIVNISSVTYGGDEAQPEYGAAKAAVASLTRSLAMELAPSITVNCIAPGLIQTSVLDRADAEMVQRYRNRSLLKRLGDPKDIANAALFLASDEAAYVTGVILPVSGGQRPAL